MINLNFFASSLDISKKPVVNSDIVASAQVVAETREAVAGCTFVLGTSGDKGSDDPSYSSSRSRHTQARQMHAHGIAHGQAQVTIEPVDHADGIACCLE